MRTARDRMRDYRARLADGKISVTATVDEAALLAALVTARLLATHEQDDRVKVNAAFERFVELMLQTDLDALRGT